MKLSHFNFDLPEELLAKFPAEHRDESRLMVLNRKEQTIEHKMFKDILDYFDDKQYNSKISKRVKLLDQK